MRDWLIIGCFVVMLMAPCVVALVASKAARQPKDETATDPAPLEAKSEVRVESADFVRPARVRSGEMQTVKIVWTKQFDSGEYPRAGGRVLRARRRV
ncbi:hypothetical protein SAMN05421770_1034 [Granulicella rosea]|uniref:Uncharacterized protein n=1 Tax=Granulicella rosea TaxID=474952 RepID=A0A239I997_9BACT|nr:hypothetical protein [Granulicella rosea]SNS90155.1 hypothetical protein SAMN05421770_1034 [Granulicella rosea]